MNKSYIQTAFHYGAYYGLSAFAFSVLLYFTLGNPLGPLSWLGAWLPVLFTCIAIRNHRDQDKNGYISYREAFRTGFFTVIFGGGLYAVLIYLFGASAEPRMFTDYKTQMLEITEHMHDYSLFSESLIKKMTEEIKKSTMASAASDDYVYKIFGGILISLVASGIYKKTKPIADPQQ